LYHKTKQGIDSAVVTLKKNRALGLIKLVCSHKKQSKGIDSAVGDPQKNRAGKI